MVKQYDAIVIGFGQGGRKIASRMAEAGWSVAMVEKSEKMYGGACVNINCVPTKVLLEAGKKGDSFAAAYQDRDALTNKMRENNYESLNAVADVYTATAHFLDNKKVELQAGDDSEILEAETIVIDTGSVPNMPPIEGLEESEYVYNSTTLQELREQPEHLGIIGAGNVGLEFALMYSQFGSQVTILERSEKILGEEEEEIAERVAEYLEEDGVEIVYQAESESIKDENGKVIVATSQGDYEFDALLCATGRTPATSELQLENTDIEVGEHEEVVVDDYLRTSVEGVFAMGDVKGGPQFTYISNDDARIIEDYLFGSKEYSLKKRENVPYTHFLNPPFSRVGLTEKEAQEQDINHTTKVLEVSKTTRANIDKKQRGVFKVVVDPDSKQILGASLLGEKSEELVNQIKTLMDNNIPYTYFESQVFTHPIMAESFNELFNI